MVRINSLKALLYAVSEMRHATNLVENQVKSTQDRLNSGTDVDGKMFAKYKTVRPSNQSRPLLLASRLFDGASLGSQEMFDGTFLQATISGNAAIIARYQNSMRRFVGFSDDDRRVARESALSIISENMKKWH